MVLPSYVLDPPSSGSPSNSSSPRATPPNFDSFVAYQLSIIHDVRSRLGEVRIGPDGRPGESGPEPLQGVPQAPRQRVRQRGRKAAVGPEVALVHLELDP